MLRVVRGNEFKAIIALGKEFVVELEEAIEQGKLDELETRLTGDENERVWATEDEARAYIEGLSDGEGWQNFEYEEI